MTGVLDLVKDPSQWEFLTRSTTIEIVNNSIDVPRYSQIPASRETLLRVFHYSKPLMKSINFGFAVILLLQLANVVNAEPFQVERTQVLELAQLNQSPSVYDVNGDAIGDELNQEGVRAIFFEGVPWKENPTRVFAWIGMPKPTGNKVPGVVLVHGGGGTAFKQWVQIWNDHGFAAISIAVEGQTDEKRSDGQWLRHQWAGPQRAGIYDDSDEPLTDQWMYHAVADTVLANSLLRSLPNVDTDQVGLTGISWGGVIASTVIGIDDRYAFAIPVYGCGSLADAANQYGRSLGSNPIYRNVWDPMIRIANVKIPTLWLSWPGDQHFPLDKQAECYRNVDGPVMVSLIPGMNHSHIAGWNPPDSYAFAKSVVETGTPWCRNIEVRREKSFATVVYQSSRPLETATLISTSDTGVTGSRTWKETPMPITSNDNNFTVEIELPSGTTGWFVNASSGPLTVSSPYQETATK